MQADRTFGVTAAITEMLFQSQDGYIKLLPALPDEWSNGELKGACTRGAFELNFSWENKKVKKLSILSKAGEICRIEKSTPTKIKMDGRTISFKKIPGGIIEFKTTRGGVYFIE